MTSKLIQASQWIKEKVGNKKGTSDGEFDTLYAKQEQLKDKAAITMKHLQQLVENFHAFQTTLGFVAEDFDAIFENDNPLKKQVQLLSTISKDIETDCIAPFQSQINGQDCIGKIKEYIEPFESLKALKKTRNEKILEYDYHKDNVQSLSEKTQKNPQALPQAKEKMNFAKEEYEKINEETKQKMVNLIEGKVEFNPIFELFILQLLQYQKKVNGLIQQISSEDVYVPTKTVERKVSTIPTKVDSKPLQSPKPEKIEKKEELEPLSMKPITLKKPTQPVQEKVVVPEKVLPKVVPKNEVTSELNVDWYYLDSAMAQKGPISISQVKTMWNKKELNEKSYVFHSKMKDWAQIKTLNELNQYLN